MKLEQTSEISKEFGECELHMRELVINMLTWESEYMCSPEGQNRYKAKGSGQFTSLDNEYSFNRRVLREFGFSTNDISVSNYRRIFQTYFRSPYDYDVEVINASHYMRNNRCVFYTSPELQIGDQIPNVPLLTLKSKNITLYDAINNYSMDQQIHNPDTKKVDEWNKLFICAFSNS